MDRLLATLARGARSLVIHRLTRGHPEPVFRLSAAEVDQLISTLTEMRKVMARAEGK